MFQRTQRDFLSRLTISVCTRYVDVCVNKDVERGWQLEASVYHGLKEGWNEDREKDWE